MKRKSKYKWYAIWTVYCILVIPLGIMSMIPRGITSIQYTGDSSWYYDYDISLYKASI